MFYANDSLVGSRDLEWLQGPLKILIGLFRQYGMVDNISKSKAMTFHPRETWSRMSEEAVVQKSTGRGENYKDSLRWRIPCPDFRVELTVGSMIAHWRRMNGTETEIDWNWLPFYQIEHLPHVFDVRFPKGNSQCQCTFPYFLGLPCTWNSLRDTLTGNIGGVTLGYWGNNPPPPSTNMNGTEDSSHLGV